jgi:hypothetical protein
MIAQRNLATAHLGIGLIYPLLAALTALAGASAPAGENTSAERPKPEWLGSRAGISDSLLPPWTAVEVSGGEVSVWGRTYRFQTLPLPASVVTREAELLAGPVTLRATVSGREVAWTGSAPQVVKTAPAAVQLSTKADCPHLRCDGKMTVELDGMIRSDISLAPSGDAATIDRLVLEIPMPAAHAKYLYHWPGKWGSAFNAGALPKEGYRGPFKPVFWLGDEWRGLQWFCESDRNFFNANVGEVIEIQPSADVILFRVHLISEPQSIRQPLEYTFGFQATPVKPMQPDAWDYRICHLGRYGLEDEPFARNTSLSYPAAGLWDPRQGTFECWIRPHFDTAQDVERSDPDRGMRLYYKQAEQYPLMLSAACDWQPSEWHHVAFTWGDATRMFIDGRNVAEQVHEGSVAGSPDEARILLGKTPCEMDIDEVRISSVARDKFDLDSAPAADGTTLLLDRFDGDEALDVVAVTTPAKGNPGKVEGGFLRDGKFGRALCFAAGEGKPHTMLDFLHDAGVRTICFHEHWTDIQAYTKTTYGEELHKLVKACHQRGLHLLLYLGYELSDAAPEWDRWHEECLVHPRRGGYKRKYQPESDQTAYIVCYRSAWQDFIADGVDRLMREYDIDGVYLDGTSEPWGCANTSHGCGYRRPDGSIGQTWPMFATRSMMRRIYAIVKSHKPDGQVNVHQSTCMTAATLAFATSYWDGEQLQSVARKGSAQEILPLDAFRCEFMGHNWGIPAELLWYPSGPFTRQEAMAAALLHDVPVRPRSTAEIEVASRLWKTMDDFGRDKADWLPYWENGNVVRTSPPGVTVSIYNRPGRGTVAVVANLGLEPARGKVTLDLLKLGQLTGLTASNVLTGSPIPSDGGRFELPLGPMEFVVVRLAAE